MVVDVDVGLWAEGVWKWDLVWRRSWFTWEHEIVQNMWDVFGDAKPS